MPGAAVHESPGTVEHTHTVYTLCASLLKRARDASPQSPMSNVLTLDYHWWMPWYPALCPWLVLCWICRPLNTTTCSPAPAWFTHPLSRMVPLTLCRRGKGSSAVCTVKPSTNEYCIMLLKAVDHFRLTIV